mgnify:CR=1 FL=1
MKIWSRDRILLMGDPMRITTWNVNGIRAALGKNLKEWMIVESPDVVCLQEIKATSQ